MNKIIVSLLIFVLFTSIVFSATAAVTVVDAEKALTLAQKNITEMIKANFSIQRVNDTYSMAKDELNAKKILESKGQSVSYNNVISLTSQITSVRNEAFVTYDELKVLEIALEPLKDKNLPQTFAVYELAKEEFYNERYEEAVEEINECYNTLSQEQSASATTQVLLESAAKTLKNFIITNWKYILGTIIGTIIFLILGYKKLSVYLVKRKLKNLEVEKNVLRELLKDTQKKYFDEGKISETEYHIKVHKFSEMIRDIERQIPLLNEELAKKK